MKLDLLLDEIKQIKKLTDSFKMSEAHIRINTLFEMFSFKDDNDILLFRRFKEDIMHLISVFNHKRKRELLTTFDNYLNKSESRIVYLPVMSKDKIDLISNDLRVQLLELHDKHIFQWITHYDSLIKSTFFRFLDYANEASNFNDILNILKYNISKHSNMIFQKGLEHKTHSIVNVAADNLKIIKSLNGLQRFLEIPLECYSASIIKKIDSNSSRAIRGVCSSIISGILDGYCNIEIINKKGSDILLDNPRTWFHYLPYLKQKDIVSINTKLNHGVLRDNIENKIYPFCYTLDKLAYDPDFVSILLPVVGSFNDEMSKLDVSLFSPFALQKQRYIDVQIYIDPIKIDKYVLDDSLYRNISLLLLPNVTELNHIIIANDSLRRRTVIVQEDRDFKDTSDKIENILKISSSSGILSDVALPITDNFAKDFPIDNPYIKKYFHVYRSSIRNLLKVFEMKNGVRLWCSVRRSGKTTACFDISSSIGSSVVVGQSCDTTYQAPNSSHFYDQIVETIEQDKSIPSNYFYDIVVQCIPEDIKNYNRIIFILDEYETFFDYMRERIKKDNIKRYTFVQPILNQMVNFSRNNLIIFVGQRPDAHNIIMDQNQLIPYVKQDHFPLFDHDNEIGSEFEMLVQKTLSEKVSYDNSFVNEIYKETSGHPYLTIKTLVVYFDWLIKNKRKYNDLYFVEDDFKSFVKDELMPSRISMNNEYNLFFNAIGEALSIEGKKSNPWLHTVYKCLKNIALRNPNTFKISRKEYIEMFRCDINPEDCGFSPEYILSTASMTNFLTYDDEGVMPKIPMLARIAAVTMPKINW